MLIGIIKLGAYQSPVRLDKHAISPKNAKVASYFGVNSLEDYTKWLKDRLYAAFFDWLTSNRKSIGEKWFSQLWKESQDDKAESRTLGGLMGTGLWIMIANLGVGAGIRIGTFDLQYLHNGIEEKSTKRLLLLISTTFCTQGLPKEVLDKEIPIISPKHFSLELYVQRRKERGL